MSGENVEVAYRAYAALQRKDLDEFLTYVDPEAEWHSLLTDMEGAVYGHDGCRQWWDLMFASFPDWRPSVREARDLGDFVLARARMKGSGAGSGVGIDQDFWQAAEFRAGRIVWYRAFRTEQDAIEAVGLRA
jgi:ketosteroid isomerase-like protein